MKSLEGSIMKESVTSEATWMELEWNRSCWEEKKARGSPSPSGFNEDDKHTACSSSWLGYCPTFMNIEWNLFLWFSDTSI